MVGKFAAVIFQGMVEIWRSQGKHLSIQPVLILTRANRMSKHQQETGKKCTFSTLKSKKKKRNSGKNRKLPIPEERLSSVDNHHSGGELNSPSVGLVSKASPLWRTIPDLHATGVPARSVHARWPVPHLERALIHSAWETSIIPALNSENAFNKVKVNLDKSNE